jgi:hypothetical protein
MRTSTGRGLITQTWNRASTNYMPPAGALRLGDARRLRAAHGLLGVDVEAGSSRTDAMSERGICAERPIRSRPT